MNTLIIRIAVIAVVAAGSFFSCQKADGAGTPEERAALFDYILEKTLERESFSPVKNIRLNLNVEIGMMQFRDEMIAADTDEELFHVLVKISNARKDRHLSVSPVEGGLDAKEYESRFAPVRFAADYGTPGNYFMFVADFARNIGDYTGDTVPEPGDRLIAVNGQPFTDYFRALEPYIRYSTVHGLWWKAAEAVTEKSFMFPQEFYDGKATYLLERKDGGQYTIELPYLDPADIEWSGYWKGHGEDRYPGFNMVFSTQTYDLYRADDGKEVLLLDWYGFREDLVQDIDRLIAFAAEHHLLDYALIFDGTRSRGGSKGAYAIQRLSPKPFKTTYGNLRISDVTQPFIDEKRRDYEQRRLNDSGVQETIDDGTWLMDWLNTDVTQAIERGDDYSNNVPFKLAHLPKDSDGIIRPAEVHFTGPLICFFGPHGGSHLDQFASIVIDNNLGRTFGMPCGGYSNTWEWEETLVFPGSGKPAASFMWSIGHTIRPNGQILEGNPAEVDEYIPVTRDNFQTYYEKLLTRALDYLEMQ